MENENSNEEIIFDSNEQNNSRPSANSCYNCKLFRNAANSAKYKSDFCKYLRQNIYNHSSCRFYTDINGPYINFKEKFKKSEKDVGEHTITFDQI